MCSTVAISWSGVGFGTGAAGGLGRGLLRHIFGFRDGVGAVRWSKWWCLLLLSSCTGPYGTVASTYLLPLLRSYPPPYV